MREKQLRKNILVFVLLTICAVMFALGVNWPQPAEAERAAKEQRTERKKR